MKDKYELVVPDSMSRSADITKSEEICRWENEKERRGALRRQDIGGGKYIS